MDSFLNIDSWFMLLGNVKPKQETCTNRRKPSQWHHVVASFYPHFPTSYFTCKHALAANDRFGSKLGLIDINFPGGNGSHHIWCCAWAMETFWILDCGTPSKWQPKKSMQKIWRTTFQWKTNMQTVKQRCSNFHFLDLEVKLPPNGSLTGEQQG